MSQPVYFQWQNEFLLKTIYPLREMKLRDFLVYYYEIDLWAKYKDKTLHDIAPEVQAYQVAQKRLWSEAYDKFCESEKYFNKEDVTDFFRKKYGDLDHDFMGKINLVHKTFIKYFPTYKNPRKEKFFLTARVNELEQLRKGIEREIANKQRILRNMEHLRKEIERDKADKAREVRLETVTGKIMNYDGQIKKLQNITLKMLDDELIMLYDFLTAFAKLEKRRGELQNWKYKKEKERDEIESRVKRKTKETEALEMTYNEVVEALGRLRNPPSYEDLKKYFLNEDVTSEYQKSFQGLSQNFMGTINRAHKQFKYFPSTKDRQKYFVDNLIKTYTRTWLVFKDVALQMAKAEIRKLKDFYEAIDNEGKTADQINSLMAQTENKRKELERQLNEKKGELRTLEDQLQAAKAALERLEKDPLAYYTSFEDVTIRDIVRGKVEEYQNELAKKNHWQLLEEVVSKFLENPERFPLWLQYMVIHFSGMRYQSSHGSWADPRDLLMSLTEKAVEQEIIRSDERVIEALCQDKIECYEAKQGAVGMLGKQGEEECQPPKLAQTKNPKWKTKVKRHLETLKSFELRVKVTPKEGKPSVSIHKNVPEGLIGIRSEDTLPKDTELTADPIPKKRDKEYYRILECQTNPKFVGFYILAEETTLIPDPRRRKALLDLRIDEESYEIEEELTDQEVLDELEQVKDQLKLPEWMWNEIVRLTDLRLKEVKDEDWETLSPEDLEQRQSYQWREYRELMDNWKRANLTGWREEHDRANRLVVTRAVCNEVAEHIQHLRGQSPPGGLTAKPEWYLRKEKDPNLARASDRPFFVKPKSAQDFKVGASILWLRFVESEPNAWRIAHPITLKKDGGLLTPALMVLQGNINSALQRTLNTGEWVYHQDPQGRFKRSRYVLDEKKTRRIETQWLRWMHEATVAEVAETADGPIVLTFETALPYEDKRRSTIGVFKHTLNELKHNITGNTFIGTFIGYVPNGDAPLEDMKEMLDWNKILRKNFVSSAQMQAYWLKVTQKATEQGSPSSGGDGAQTTAGQPQTRPDTQVEVAPPISRENHREWVVCFEIDAAKKIAKVYNPRVELMRGTRLRVSKTDAVKIGQDTYYQVTWCDREPRAQDLYVRAGEVLDAPEARSSMPVATKDRLNLQRIVYANKGGYPVIEEYRTKETKQKIQLMPGTKFRVSKVHKVTGDDAGDGIIKGDPIRSAYLIIECPSKISAQGLFVKTEDVQPITDKEYAQSTTLPEAAASQKLRVKVTPRDSNDSIYLFKDAPGGKVRSPAGVLPKDVEVILAPELEFESGKEYYSILEYPPNPKYEGLYVNVKDVTLIPETITEAGVTVPVTK